VVYTEKGKTFILSTLPTMLMNLIQNDKLKSTAEQIESKLKAAVDRVG
jgi:hypothetical protein